VCSRDRSILGRDTPILNTVSTGICTAGPKKTLDVVVEILLGPIYSVPWPDTPSQKNPAGALAAKAFRQ
jgi:hypothetical protein